MTLGLRSLLLIAAVVLFVIAVFNRSNWDKWVALGLACSAGATLVREMGWDRMLGGSNA